MGEDSSNILEIAKATIFMGACVPGVIVLVLAGYASNADYLSPPLVLSTALSGVIAGDNASFFGRFFGKHCINFPERIHLASKKNRWILLFFHHVPLSRMFIPAFFGMNGQMRFKDWIGLDVFSAVLFVSTYFSIGLVAHRFSKEIRSLYETFNICIFAFCLALLAYWVLNLFRDKVKKD